MLHHFRLLLLLLFFIPGNLKAHFITNHQELLPTATAVMREEAK